MKYRVTIEGQEREVDVEITPDGRAVAAVDGKPVDADIRRVPGGVHLILNGKAYDVAVAGSGETRTVSAGEARAIATVESERARHKKKAAGGGAGEKEITAPMPGRIVKILVAPGDEVAAQQPVIVIEAMKMENELRASGDGKVKAVHVEEGASVEGGVLLLSFE